GIPLPMTRRTPSFVECTVPLSIGAGNMVSAGSLPIVAAQLLGSGHTLSSNALTGGLLPRLNTAVPSNATPLNPNPGAPVTAVIDMTGILLGTANDSVFLGMSANGKVIRIFDQFTRPTADQTTLRLTIATASAVPPGTYRLILRVNGQQALNSPEVML